MSIKSTQMLYLCDVDNIDPQQGLILTLPERDGILLVRRGEQVYAYINRCPHAFTRLNLGSERIIALDGYHLLCSVHGAQFNPTTGKCVLGPCKGQSLEMVSICIKENQVWLNQTAIDEQNNSTHEI